MILSNYGVVVQAFYICHLQPIKLSKYIKSVEIVAIQVLGFIEDEWTFNIASFMKNILQLNHPSMHLDMCTKFYSLQFFLICRVFLTTKPLPNGKAKVQYCIDDKNSWRFAKCKFWVAN